MCPQPLRGPSGQEEEVVAHKGPPCGSGGG